MRCPVSSLGLARLSATDRDSRSDGHRHLAMGGRRLIEVNGVVRDLAEQLSAIEHKIDGGALRDAGSPSEHH